MLRANGVTRAVARLALQAKKQSPHIFFGAGLAGVITGGALACRATLKIEDELDDLKRNLETIKEAKEAGIEVASATSGEAVAVNGNYYQNLRIRAFAHGGIRITRLYGPAIAITGIGIACLAGSHVQLTRRNAALQATLVAVQSAYDEYRARIREEIGEEREDAIFRNLDGVTDKNAPTDRDPNKFSVYARVFDETNPNWKKDAELNRVHIQCQQNYANHMLTARGHVFLNEVYDVLGFEHSREGSIVGWIMNSHGDNYIDFGMFEVRNASFINGTERSVWLDFNVDGVIFDKI